MSMIEKMLHLDYEKRPTIKELLEDKWIVGGEVKGWWMINAGEQGGCLD